MEEVKPKLVVIGGKAAVVPAGTEIPKGETSMKEELLDFLAEIRKQVEAGEVVGMVGLLIKNDGDQVEYACSDINSFEAMGRLTSMVRSIDDEDF